MAALPELEGAALRLAERMIQLLDEGSFSATYKYAVLVGLLDLCLERTTTTGSPPQFITTRQLAEKVIEIYWPHCRPYPHHEVPGASLVLRQTSTGDQAEIVQRIQDFQARIPVDAAGATSLARARIEAGPRVYMRLVHYVEWKLVEMPLTRLQTIGSTRDDFLYTYNFSKDTPHSVIRSYDQSSAPAFDNRLELQPNVGASLIVLNGLMRPLIHRQWARMVAGQNKLPQALLEDFLFDCQRQSLAAVRPGLWELQKRACFYCEKRMAFTCHVDHFIPWSRHADDGIDNLVAAHEECNGQKRDHLASATHVARWRERSRLHASALADIAVETKWGSGPDRTFSAARAIYLALPDGARLWNAGGEFVTIDRASIISALAA